MVGEGVGGKGRQQEGGEESKVVGALVIRPWGAAREVVKSAGVAEVVGRLAGEAGLLGSKIDFDLQVQIANMKQAGAEE